MELTVWIKWAELATNLTTNSCLDLSRLKISKQKANSSKSPQRLAAPPQVSGAICSALRHRMSRRYALDSSAWIWSRDRSGKLTGNIADFHNVLYQLLTVRLSHRGR